MKKKAQIRSAIELPVLAAYSAAAAFVFFLVMFFYSKFNLSAPLDDAFIYFQYAKNMAKGRFFEYVAGEGYSSGATSFIYVFLLTPFALFLKGGAMIITSYLFGGLCLYFSGLYIHKLVSHLTGSVYYAWLGAAVYVTNGNILWGYFSGMEICLFSTLIIASLYYLAAGESLKKTIITLSLLSVVRPEGFILTVMLAGTKLIQRFFNREEKFLPYLIPLVPGALYFLINYIFTGDPMPNTMRSKSDFSQPFFYAPEVFRHGMSFYTKFINEILNGSVQHYFPAYFLFLFLAGSLPGMAREISVKKAGVFTAAFFWLFIGIMSTVFSSFVSVHNYRYPMPFIIIFASFGIIGLWNILGALGREDKKPGRLFTAAAALFIFFNVFTVAANLVNFGRDCRDIYSQSISAGKWIKNNIDPKLTVAINDAGAITYYSDAKVYDLVGLVSNGQAKYFRLGTGAVFERIERIKPEIFMVHLGWFNYERFSFFGRDRLTDFHIKREPPYYVVGSPEVGVKLKPETLDSGNSITDKKLLAGMAAADRLDVLDLTSEKDHGFAIWERRIPDVPGTLMEEEQGVTDAGRITGGGMQFVMAAPKGAAAGRLVMRSYDTPSCILGVEINGVKAGEWKITERSGFGEQAFDINAGLLSGRHNKIILTAAEKKRFNAFHFWLLSGGN